MIKFTRHLIIILLAVSAFGVKAQSTATTSSPYSKYGLGDLTPTVLPQNIGMGGLGAAINNFSGYFNINPLNPASYGKLGGGLAVIDIGVYGNSISLSQTGQTGQRNGNFRLSHVNFAFPVTKKSAFSFGLMPYTQLGYSYSQTKANLGSGSSVDTSAVNYIYSGNGGLSKAYIGYGIALGKHLLVGANVSYIFGNLQEYRSTEIPTLFGTLNSRVEDSHSLGGLNYDYGAQYSIDLTSKKHIILGYSASANSKITSQYTNIVSQYTTTSGSEGVALDSLVSTQSPKSKLELPQLNHFGLTFVNDNKYLVGVEYSTGNWSKLAIDGLNAGLQNSQTFNIGGQITPNILSLSNYWATVDYRLGFVYDKSYIDVINADNNSSTNIKSYAVTFGVGLPLRPSTYSFYKINVAAEVGQRGTLAQGLVKEKYINFHLSFTLNDRWFIKSKLD